MMENLENNPLARLSVLRAALDSLDDPNQPQNHDVFGQLKETSQHNAILEQANNICAFLQKEWEVRQRFALLLRELAETFEPDAIESKLKQLRESSVDWKEKVDALIRLGVTFSQYEMRTQASQIWMQAEQICQMDVSTPPRTWLFLVFGEPVGTFIENIASQPR